MESCVTGENSLDVERAAFVRLLVGLAALRTWFEGMGAGWTVLEFLRPVRREVACIDPLPGFVRCRGFVSSSSLLVAMSSSSLLVAMYSSSLRVAESPFEATGAVVFALMPMRDVLLARGSSSFVSTGMLSSTSGTCTMSPVSSPSELSSILILLFIMKAARMPPGSSPSELALAFVLLFIVKAPVRQKVFCQRVFLLIESGCVCDES